MNSYYIPKEIVIARRSKLATLLLPNSLLIVLSASDLIRNHDVVYPFRQASSFWYLTGINQKDLAYIMYKDTDGQVEERIYFVSQLAAEARWVGTGMGIQDLQEISGIETFISGDKFAHDLVILTKGSSQCYFEPATCYHPLAVSIPHDLRFTSSRTLLAGLRMYKDHWELEQMQKAADISIRAHSRAVKRLLSPHTYEYHVAAALEYEYTQANCRWAYPSIVAGGNNACTLHYINNNQLLTKNTLCLIDAGCEYNYYAADITRTYPVSGKYSDAQRKIYEIVLAAQEAAILAIQHSQATMKSYHLAAVNVLVQGLIDLNILQGSVIEHVRKRSYQTYFNHSTGHFLGLDVHDSGIYKDDQGQPSPLTNGMVVTVEPGLYFAKDDLSVPAEFRGIGIRIEDDIVKTDQGIQNLTVALPKTVEQIEQWIGAL